MSSAAIVIVLVRALYSSDSLPTLMSEPCFEVREALRLNRFVLISCYYQGDADPQLLILLFHICGSNADLRAAADSNSAGICRLDVADHDCVRNAALVERCDNRVDPL